MNERKIESEAVVKSLVRDEKMRSIKTEIIEIANQIINEKIDVLDGCRKLVYFQHKLEKSPLAFLVLRGIVSETDVFPIAQAEREQWNPEVVSRLDKEKNQYISLVKEQMVEACREIINTLLE